MLRSLKRKRDSNGMEDNGSEEPPRKKSKVYKHRLYINDISTFETELYKIFQFGVEEIIAERAKRPFISEKDLIQRVPSITKESIQKANVKLIFKTRFEEQSDIIFETLMTMESLNNQSSQTIKSISEFATGDIETCDNPKCDEEILILNDNPTPNDDGISSLPLPTDKFTYTYYQGIEREDKPYYHRVSERYGEALYCAKCADQLAMCHRCQKITYFMNDPDSYRICLGVLHGSCNAKLCLDCESERCRGHEKRHHVLQLKRNLWMRRDSF